jgi:signal peptidase I
VATEGTRIEGREAREREDGPPPTFGRKVLRWVKELAIVLVSALILSFIIKTFFFQSFWIPSTSMAPTLEVGDRVLVTKWRPGPMDLRHGDVIVFRDPGHWLDGQPPLVSTDGWVADVLTFVGLMPGDAGEHLVKRVIGLPGDTVACPDPHGPVYLNGVPLDEPYLEPGVEGCDGSPRDASWTVTVPADRVWVMGDNRPGSRDSRFHTVEPGGGSVPMENIVGSAFVTVWPLSHWGGIGNPLAGAEAATVSGSTE